MEVGGVFLQAPPLSFKLLPPVPCFLPPAGGARLPQPAAASLHPSFSHVLVPVLSLKKELKLGFPLASGTRQRNDPGA